MGGIVPSLNLERMRLGHGGVGGIVPSLVGNTSFAWAGGVGGGAVDSVFGWKDFICLGWGWGSGGDSSVIELRGKDLIRSFAWAVGGIVPSLNFLGKTSFAVSFVLPCLRIFQPLNSYQMPQTLKARIPATYTGKQMCRNSEHQSNITCYVMRCAVFYSSS